MIERKIASVLVILLGLPTGPRAEDDIGVTRQYQKVVQPIQFEYPTVARPATGEGYRLDWCYEWGIKCGAEAAEAFCVVMGYRIAVDWAPDPNIGARSPTLVLKDQAICRQEFCDGFAFIACSP